jgi:peptidoglycan/xylan/chitin deacetylase (PgdA/CDA1 family)
VPWRKRFLVLLALGGGLAVLGLAATLARLGRASEGLLLASGTAVVAVAALHALWPRFDVTGRSLRRGPSASAAVALTFDDGPSADTPAVLDALERAGVRATFFVLGEAAEKRPELVRELARRGHAVGLHGHTHARLAFAGPATVAREIDRCRAAVRAAGVEPAPWFRAPHGWKGPFLSRALRERGLTLVAWTRGAWDTERPGAGAIAERASRAPRGGEILLLHDGCGTPGIDPRRDQTAEAVPEIVRRWREAGFAFVTLDALRGERDRRLLAKPPEAR